MYLQHSLKPIAVLVLAVCTGQVASNPDQFPPVIYGRACTNFPGALVSAPTKDCQAAIDMIATDTGYITGATKGYLEVSSSGGCAISLGVPATVRKSSLAAAAQDILSGCQASDPEHTSGTISMFGFQISADPNAPQGGEFSFTIGASGIGLPPNRKRVAAPPEEASHPSRIHVKDLLPTLDRSTILPRDQTVFIVTGTGYTLVVADSERPGWEIDPIDENDVTQNLLDNFNLQQGTDFVAYGTLTTTDGRNLQLANGYYARQGEDIGSVNPDDREQLIDALHQFRAQQGNPGWFAVQVRNGANLVLGDMFFDLAAAAGPQLL